MPPPDAARPPLRRLRQGRWVAGVCVGLARRLGLGVGWVRALFVVGTLVPVVPGLPLYLLLWLIVRPEQASPSSTGPPVESSPGRSHPGG